MDDKLLREMRSDAEEIFVGSLEAVDPYRAVGRHAFMEGNNLRVGGEGPGALSLDLESFERIFLVGAGKATAPMARAMETILNDRIWKGLITVKYGFAEKLTRTEIIEADHPLPDAQGVEGAHRMFSLLESAGENDLVISLISGGGSALLPLPAGDISLSEKQWLTRSLLECGASIHEINSVRKHISSSKGGGMARAAFPATVINLILSDVVGDNLDVIASGPFVPDTSTFADAWGILEKYGLKEAPESIRKHLKSGMQGGIPETPKPDAPIFEKVFNFIVGSNIIALETARNIAQKKGYEAMILSSMVEGETREVALVHTAIAKEIIKSGLPIPPPACIITGGETTVTIRGKGLGGRNQEFCLAAALDIEGFPSRMVILSGGTDGNDGPTDAAGAIVDPFTINRGRKAGLEGSSYLIDNDSYHFFDKTGDLLVTGPTKTNVMDIRLVLVR